MIELVRLLYRFYFLLQACIQLKRFVVDEVVNGAVIAQVRKDLLHAGNGLLCKGGAFNKIAGRHLVLVMGCKLNSFF